MVTLAFPRELRLLTPDSFTHVFQQPQRANSPFITILGRENALGRPRLGFAISKKHVKLAHERNRIKRLARERFRLLQHQLPTMDFIILARKGAIDLDNCALVEIFDKLWSRHCRLARGC